MCSLANLSSLGDFLITTDIHKICICTWILCSNVENLAVIYLCGGGSGSVHACIHSILSGEPLRLLVMSEDRWLNSQVSDQVCMHRNYSVTA